MNVISDLLIGFLQMRYQTKGIIQYFKMLQKISISVNFANQIAVKNFELLTKKS